jgi:hypothetical protein
MASASSIASPPQACVDGSDYAAQTVAGMNRSADVQKKCAYPEHFSPRLTRGAMPPKAHGHV